MILSILHLLCREVLGQATPSSLVFPVPAWFSKGSCLLSIISPLFLTYVHAPLYEADLLLVTIA